MSGAAISLSFGQLAETLPWHFVLDAELRVVSAGRVLRRLVPGIEGARLADSFAPLRPDAMPSLAILLNETGRCWMFECRALPLLVLRGQLVPTGDDRFLFFGGPRASLDVITALGLTLNDFAAHDPIGDCLFLLHAQQASLADAARFSRQLEEINSGLEVRLDREKAERERVEGELRLAHRLEAVGQLAAGVAHEINTPIQYVGDSVQFLADAYLELTQLDPAYTRAIDALRARGDERTAASMEALRSEIDAEFLLAQVPRAFERAFDGLRQVAGIVRAMKAFAHPGEATRTSADINDALANTLAVARNEYKYVADVETEFAALPRIPCYAAELNQVFLNLVVNAAHAVAQSVEGTTRRGHIRVRTSIDNECAAIEVSDDGVGIPDAIKERIFDPFFTTKPVGKGTGQGLTIARSIVTKHQGRVEVRSRVGHGTTIRVLLPIEDRTAA